MNNRLTSLRQMNDEMFILTITVDRWEITLTTTPTEGFWNTF